MPALDQVVVVDCPTDIALTYDPPVKDPSEIAVVRDIYERFVRHGEAELQIASSLNHRGIVSDLRRPWTRATIHQILTNPKYVGTNVYIPLYLCADEVGSTEPVVNRESDDSARIVAPLAQ